MVTLVRGVVLSGMMWVLRRWIANMPLCQKRAEKVEERPIAGVGLTLR